MLFRSDMNNGMTTMGRVGLFPGLGKSLEIGASFASGGLRDTADASRALDDPQRYGADFLAVGLDAGFQRGAIGSRAYVLASTEQFDQTLRASATPASLSRRGAMLELNYAIAAADLPFGITRVTPKARIDVSKVEALTPSGSAKTSYQSRIFSIGSTLAPQERILLSVEYHFRREGTRAPLSNDRLVLRMTAEF